MPGYVALRHITSPRVSWPVSLGLLAVATWAVIDSLGSNTGLAFVWAFLASFTLVLVASAIENMITRRR